MSEYYSIKRFSELADVTSDTLRYYDKIGLLKPTKKSPRSYRLYTKQDLAQLQQITTLRYLGFSIEQMKQVLSNRSLDIKQSLQVQEMIMREKSKHLEEAAQLIKRLIENLDQSNLIDWNIQSKVIEVLKLQEAGKNEWYKIFLTSKEQKEFQALSQKQTPEYWEDYRARWSTLFNDIQAHLTTDPESDIGLQFAKRWFDLVNEVYADNRALGNKLWEGYKAGVIGDSALPYQAEVIEYMAKAKKKYKEMQSTDSF
ncbi:MAG: putative transcriptional regulator [Gammaproteobacteria bacterium]|jgi:DNA-binding transcriptional MerR regulator|nr:putative transcriptional regulator [Gammaproteobacteria bacterium]